MSFENWKYLLDILWRSLGFAFPPPNSDDQTTISPFMIILTNEDDIVEKLVSFAEARSSNPTPNVVLDGIKERVEKYELNHQQLQQIIIQLRTEADIRMESVEARLDVQQSKIAETRLEVQQLR